jgi:hypothetical protein
VTRIRPAVWLMAAVALFLLAVAGYALLVHASPHYYWRQIDTAVYRDGGIAVRNQPAMLYALRLGPAKLPFIYTPFAALLFAAGSGASFATWQVGLAVLTTGLLPVVAYLALGLAGRPAGLARAAAAFAIAAVGLWLEPMGAENLRHLGRCSADRGRRGPRSSVGRAGPGPSGGGMIFGLWA